MRLTDRIRLHRGQQPLPLLPKWNYYSAGALAAFVLDQIEDDADRRIVGCMFTRAAIDLIIETRWQKLRPGIGLFEHADNMWTVGKAAYTYIAEFDDDAIDHCLNLVVWSINTHIIVPPESDHLLRLALDHTLGRSRPVVLSLTDFLNTQVSQSVVDADLADHDAVKRLLESYNMNILTETNGDERLTLELPWEG